MYLFESSEGFLSLYFVVIINE